MTTISLAYFLVTITDNAENRLFLGDFSQSKSLLDILTDYMKERTHEPLVDAGKNKVLHVEQINTNHATAKGIINMGQYGQSAELMDVTSINKTYSQSPNEAAMTPHYFQAYLPPGSDHGILILQKNSGKGAQGILFHDFNTYSKNYQPNGTLNFKTLIPLDYIDYLRKEGRMTKITFLKKELHHDIQSKFQSTFHNAQSRLTGSAELTYKPQRSGLFPHALYEWGLSLLKDQTQKDRMATVIGQEYNEVKLEIEIGGRKKTVNIDRFDTLKTDLDITEKLCKNNEGHPEFDSIDTLATELLTGILEDLGVHTQNVNEN